MLLGPSTRALALGYIMPAGAHADDSVRQQVMGRSKTSNSTRLPSEVSCFKIGASLQKLLIILLAVSSTTAGCLALANSTFPFARAHGNSAGHSCLVAESRDSNLTSCLTGASDASRSVQAQEDFYSETSSCLPHGNSAGLSCLFAESTDSN